MAQAVKTHLDNSLDTFVPLGLGQLYRVLQGCEVCLLLPSSAPSAVQTSANFSSSSGALHCHWEDIIQSVHRIVFMHNLCVHPEN